MRHVDPKCRLCRSERAKLFLKGERCFSPKCPIDKKQAVVPGVHGAKRTRRVSEYGVRLREKQKMKRMYDVTEKQFKGYVMKAKKAKEETGQTLFRLLESRLDSVVYHLGFVPAKSSARQLIAHGHILVDGKRVDVPSYQVQPDQVISLKPKTLKLQQVIANSKKKDIVLPEWLEKKGPAGRMKRLPDRDEMTADINERLIVEYYSR